MVYLVSWMVSSSWSVCSALAGYLTLNFNLASGMKIKVDFAVRQGVCGEMFHMLVAEHLYHYD